MLRRGLFILALVFCTSGIAQAQGFFDSVLGPGGLGLWGASDPGSISNPNYGAQGSYPQQQGNPYQGQVPPTNTPGVYSDWQNYPAATVGNPNEMQYPEVPQAQVNQQQYQMPQEQQYPQQQYQQQPYPQQQQYPQQQYQQPVANQQQPASWQAPPQPQQPRQQLRPGQYSPNQPPPQRQVQQPPAQPQYQGPQPVPADDLPAGAVRVTTTTPDGTTVEYYPPGGAPQNELQAQQPRPKPRAAKPSAKQKQQTSPGNIAMPKPVDAPPNQDPRYGWGAVPAAPEQ